MDKKVIEETLYIFFNSNSFMKYLNEMITLIDTHIEKIEQQCNKCTSPAVIQVMTEQKENNQLDKQQTLDKIDKLKELINRIKSKFDSLPDEYVKLLELKYGKGYTQEQIAAKLHMSQSKVSKTTKVILTKIAVA